MIHNISLKTQIYLILLAIVAVVAGGGGIIILYTNEISSNISNVIYKNLEAYQTAEKLENALINQKGFVSYYYIDKNPDWLRRLGEYRQMFRERLVEIKKLAHTEQQKQSIQLIEEKYNRYIKLKDQVIGYYSEGGTYAGADLHQKARDQFFSILDACESHKLLHEEKIRASWDRSQKMTSRLIGSVIATAAIVAVLVFGLLVLLITQLLGPLHQISKESSKGSLDSDARDDIRILSMNVKGLINEANQAQVKLKQNREVLIQSEKLALVGKLAAGMAHSIRNPLTSVNMRLFSLGRSLELNESQKEDFEVIAEEIKHLDIIVQNFLEFSRPPKLTMMPVSLSTVVDQSLQLLTHRLKSYNVVAEVERAEMLPSVMGDQEQLKEVFINLIVNACEAMNTGGSIVIREDVVTTSQHKFARVIIVDSGYGIPEVLIDKVFQPFFTTKDEGTGLGLSIASRIIQDHGGIMEVESPSEQGTIFRIMLPISGDKT